MVAVVVYSYSSTSYRLGLIWRSCRSIRHEDLALYHGCSRTGVGVGNLLGIPLLSARLSSGSLVDTGMTVQPRVGPWQNGKLCNQPGPKQGNCRKMSADALKLKRSQNLISQLELPESTALTDTTARSAGRAAGLHCCPNLIRPRAK